VAAGLAYGVALKADGTVAVWGSASSVLDIPAGLSNVVAIASGTDHCLALKADGTVIAWGRNDFSQTVVPEGLTNVVAVSAGDYHSFALVHDHPPVLTALAENPAFNGTNFSVQIPTQSGRVYRLEYKQSLADADWIPLPLVAGNGKTLTLMDQSAGASDRYYRVRWW
jgi:hypothetical protein